MPRRYGGLNFPITAYTAINEMIASADAGFENIWSLQDCIETLYEFGDEDQRDGGVYVRRIKNRRSSTRIDNNCTFVYLFLHKKKRADKSILLL
nr:acyl-CoA dehydrogenase family protein [Fibrobacter sp.]